MILPEGFHCEFDGLAEGLAQAPSVSIRVNPHKAVALPDSADRVPWHKGGMYIDGRPRFTFDPALHQGLYYVQDASSMIIGHLVDTIMPYLPPAPIVLDACAAPGGKTIALVDALPDDSFVVANEYIAARATVLHENLIKWGTPNVAVARGDTSRISALGSTFDLILADVPCSGEGMFRKDPEAVSQWSPALVAQCAARQRDIVTNLWDALKPGGIMIYSTCTFNRQENEDIIQWMQSDLNARAMTPATPWPEIVQREQCLHFLPGRVRGEGLTVAIVQKPHDTAAATSRTDTRRIRQSNKKAPASIKVPEICRTWLDDSRRWSIAANENIITATDPAHAEIIRRITAKLDIISYGIPMATIKGHDMIPTQALALSSALRRSIFPEAEIPYSEAMAYLHRDAINRLPEDTPRGHILLTYGGKPLGFVKNLGNRVNNLYPQQWRILSNHIPDEPPHVILR